MRVDAGRLAGDRHSVARGCLPGNREIRIRDRHFGLQIDRAGDVEYDSAWPTGRDSGAKAAGPGVVEIGDVDYAATASARRDRTPAFSTGKCRHGGRAIRGDANHRNCQTDHSCCRAHDLVPGGPVSGGIGIVYGEALPSCPTRAAVNNTASATSVAGSGTLAEPVAPEEEPLPAALPKLAR